MRIGGTTLLHIYKVKCYTVKIIRAGGCNVVDNVDYV